MNFLLRFWVAISLFNALYSKTLDYNELRVIRSLRYSLRTTLSDTFGKKGRKFILIDYPAHQKAYRFFDLDSHTSFCQ